MGEVPAWHRNPDVPAGMRELVACMEKGEGFRAECFKIGVGAQGHGDDRPLAGQGGGIDAGAGAGG